MIQETIYSILKRCIDTLEQLQTAQSLNSQSVRSKTTYSSNQYDYLVYQTATIERWRLSVTPNSGKLSLIDMKYWFRLGSPDVMASPQQPTPTASVVTVKYVQNRPTGTTLSWDFKIMSNLDGLPPPHNVYFKFMFSGTDDVTWTMVKL